MWIIVAQEQHSSGTVPHLHVVLKLKSRIRIDHSLLDKATGKHGNYQSPRNVGHVVKYVTKDDDQPWCLDIDWKKYLANIEAKQSGTKSDYVMGLVQDGKTLDEIAILEPGFALMQKTKIEGWIDHVLERKELEEKLEWNDIIDSLQVDVIESEMDEISDWLSKNVKRPRIFKQRQLWIWGLKNMGKTSLINHLEKYLKMYWIQTGKYEDKYRDNQYDIAVIDEFRACKTIQWLNLWLQGGAMPLTVRYKDYVKRHNIPTIILSNLSVGECYYKSSLESLEPLYERLLVVHVKSFIDIFE